MNTLLNFLISSGMLSLSDTDLVIFMTERKKYLTEHPYKIYQGKDNCWHTYLPDDTKTTGRRHVKRRTQAEVEEAVIFYWKDRDDNPTLKEVFDEWLERKLSMNKIKKSTATRYRSDFERYFAEFGSRQIRSVKPEEYVDFMERQLATQHLTAKAFSNLRTILRGMLKRAKKRKLVIFDVEGMFNDLDVTDRDFKRRVVDDSLEIFYSDEYEQIMNYCRKHADDVKSLGVALMLVSGLRIGELVALKPSDILDGAIYVHRTETRYEEDGHWRHDIIEYPKTPAGVRRVLIPKSYFWLLDRLKLLSLNNEFLFCNKHGERYHTADVRKRQYYICNKLGIPVRSPHKSRKTYGTILLDNNVGTKFIEKQMGHSDISCTELHYHRDRQRDEAKREIINSIPDFC